MLLNTFVQPMILLIYVIMYFTQEKTLITYHISFALFFGTLFNKLSKLKAYFNAFLKIFILLNIQPTEREESSWICIVRFSGASKIVVSLFGFSLCVGDTVSRWEYNFLINFHKSLYKVLFWHLDDSEGYYLLSIIIGLCHGIVMGLGRLTDESQSRCHFFEGWVGYIHYLLCLFKP